MNQQQRRDATQAFKETQQAIDALKAARQQVETREVIAGEVYDGELQTENSFRITFYGGQLGTVEYRAIVDSLTSTTP